MVASLCLFSPGTSILFHRGCTTLCAHLQCTGEIDLASFLRVELRRSKFPVTKSRSHGDKKKKKSIGNTGSNIVITSCNDGWQLGSPCGMLGIVCSCAIPVRPPETNMTLCVHSVKATAPEWRQATSREFRWQDPEPDVSQELGGSLPLVDPCVPGVAWQGRAEFYAQPPLIWSPCRAQFSPHVAVPVDACPVSASPFLHPNTAALLFTLRARDMFTGPGCWGRRWGGREDKGPPGAEGG